MKKSEAFELGKVLKPDGFDGSMLITVDADTPERYSSVTSVWLGAESPDQEYRVKKVEIHKNRSATILLEGFSSEDDVVKVKGLIVWLPLTLLPPLEGTMFYHHEVSGYSAIQDGKVVGVIKGVLELPHQKLLEIDINGKEILLPIQPEFYLGIDRIKRALVVRIPDGLADL